MFPSQILTLRAKRVFLIVFLIALSLMIKPLQAQEISDPCAGVADQFKLLQDEKSAQASRFDNLKKITESGPFEGTSLKALLEVDLSDENAVTQKIKSLNEFVNKVATNIVAPKDVAPTNDPPCEVNPQDSEIQSRLKELKIQNAQLALALLDRPRAERLDFIELEKSVNASSGQIKELEKTEKELGKKQEDATKSLNEARAALENSSNANAKSLASERIILESFRKTLAEKQEESVTRLKNQAEDRSQLAIRISSYKESLAASFLDESTLKKVYPLLIDDWRNTVDTSTSILAFLKTQSLELPPLPSYPEKLLESLKESTEAKEYVSVYQKEKKGLESFKAEEQLRLTERLVARDILLRDITQLRSLLLERFRELENNLPYEWNQSFFADIGRELKLVSYKFGYFLATTVQSLGLYWDDSSQLAFDQKIKLAKESANLFWLAVYLVIFFYALRKRHTWIRRIDNHIASRRDHSSFDKIFFFVRRHEKFLPSLISYAGLRFIETKLSGTFLEGLLGVFPYLFYLVGYQFFLVFFDTILGLLSGRAIYANSVIRDKARRSGLWIGRFFLIVAIVNRITEQSVGRAIIYSYVQTFVWIVCGFIFFLVAFFWRQELRQILKEGKTLSLPDRFKSLLDGPLAFFLCLPLAVTVALIQIYRLISQWVSRLERFKKISALIFKRQLQKKLEQEEAKFQGDDSDLLPEDYSRIFSLGPVKDEQFWLDSEESIDKPVSDLVNNWINEESSETTVAVYGDKGIGKSSLAIHLQKSFSETKIHTAIVPPKLLNEASVVSFLSGLFGFEAVTEMNDLVERLEAIETKTLVILDECQNLFLGCLDGFHGYNSFIGLLNKNIKNVFWCCFFNNYSWRFLNEVASRNHFFRRIFRMPVWSEERIKNLILSRHQASDYHLDFQGIGLDSYQMQDDLDQVSEIETKFFRLLWDHSHGNPRVAMDTWLNSLCHIGDKELAVTLFETKSLQKLDKLSDEVHFVLAAIVKHENLTLAEAVEVTSQSISVCDYAFSIGRELGFLSCDAQGRYRLTPQWQYPVIDYLKRKNFIYGN